MKTFNIFKEDLKKSLSPLKDFGKSFAGQAKEFAKSKEAKDLKTNVMNMFIGKGEELLNKGSAKLKDVKTKVNK